MKVAYLLIVFCLISCKKLNSTAEGSKNIKMSFDHSVYLNIPHGKDQSILRRKSANLVFNRNLKQENINGEKTVIKDSDEFYFLDNSLEAIKVNKEEYKYYRENAAEIIVSYVDRIEIYFVPTGIRADQVLNSLGIFPDSGAMFYWVNPIEEKLIKNKRYYLLSASESELIENDNYFFKRTFDVYQDIYERVFNFSRNQVLELTVEVEYLNRKTHLAARESGRVGNCTRDLQEAGMCDPCSYKIEELDQNYVSVELEKFELENLEILVDNERFNFNTLKSERVAKNKFKFTLNLKNWALNNAVSVQLVNQETAPIYKSIAGFDYSRRCLDRNINEIINISPKIEIKSELTILGRELNL